MQASFFVLALRGYPPLRVFFYERACKVLKTKGGVRKKAVKSLEGVEKIRDNSTFEAGDSRLEI
jgi:hypothetical protein